MNLTLQVLAAKHDNIIRLSESYKPFPKFGNRLIAFTSFIFLIVWMSLPKDYEMIECRQRCCITKGNPEMSHVLLRNIAINNLIIMFFSLSFSFQSEICSIHYLISLALFGYCPLYYLKWIMCIRMVWIKYSAMIVCSECCTNCNSNSEKQEDIKILF